MHNQFSYCFFASHKCSRQIYRRNSYKIRFHLSVPTYK